MSNPFAVVGPGRVGAALARRWHEHGYRLLGFVGRGVASVDRAVAFCGAGARLEWSELASATFVLLSVGDPELEAAVDTAVRAGAVRRCSLWLHASGRHDLEVLAPLREAGARVGSLHPLCPFPDAETGYRGLPGQPGVIAGDPRAERLLGVLARNAGLQPVPVRGGDRVSYHAACALAANGLTALFELVERLFVRSCSVDVAQADALTAALMRGALTACAERGPLAALSGPVQRGDVATIEDHVAALRGAMPGALPIYRALMHRAVSIARQQGDLDEARGVRIEQLLDGGDRG